MKKSYLLDKTILVVWFFVLIANAAHAEIIRDQGRILLTDGEVNLGTDVDLRLKLTRDLHLLLTRQSGRIMA